MAAVKNGDARYAMIPIENSVAGRVADIHHLLPKADLFIVGEHFLRVRHNLLALPGASLTTVKRVLSHTQALGQCRTTLRRLGMTPVPEADTAGSARIVSESGDLSQAAIASELAATEYGLNILMRGIEDVGDNTTRFIVLSADEQQAQQADGPIVTTFIFRVRNVPAALYKALGGFATNGINMTKLEVLPGGGFHGDHVLCRHRGSSLGSGRALRVRRAAVLFQRAHDPGRLQGQSLAQGAGQAERRRAHQGPHGLIG